MSGQLEFVSRDSRQTSSLAIQPSSEAFGSTLGVAISRSMALLVGFAPLCPPYQFAPYLVRLLCVILTRLPRCSESPLYIAAFPYRSSLSGSLSLFNILDVAVCVLKHAHFTCFVWSHADCISTWERECCRNCKRGPSCRKGSFY